MATPDTQDTGTGVNDENAKMSVQAARTAQLRTYELAEEKQAWMLLIRQAILDCQFLDAAAEDCKVPASMLPQTPSTPRSLSLHSIAFATSILGILDGQHLATLNNSVDSLALSVTSLCATEMAALCDMRTDHLSNTESNPFGARTTSTPGMARSRENSHNSLISDMDARSICLYPDAYSSRTAVAQRTVLLKSIQDRACEMFISSFSDICADYRPVVEIHGVAMLRGRGKEEEVCYSTLLLRKFVESVCVAFEKAVHVSAPGFFGRSSLENFYREENPFKVRVCLSVCLSMYPSFYLFVRLSLILSTESYNSILLRHHPSSFSSLSPRSSNF